MGLHVNNITEMYMYANGLVKGQAANMVILELRFDDNDTISNNGAWDTKPFYVYVLWASFSGFLLTGTDLSIANINIF